MVGQAAEVVRAHDRVGVKSGGDDSLKRNVSRRQRGCCGCCRERDIGAFHPRLAWQTIRVHHHEEIEKVRSVLLRQRLRVALDRLLGPGFHRQH